MEATMNATINRNVILDLLPAYVGGEASQETRALVEAFAKSDAQIERLLQSGSLPNGGAEKRSSAELEALKRVKRRLRKQGYYLGFAIFFAFLTITFQIGDTGVHWTWQEYPAMAVVFGIVAVIFWLAYSASRKRLRGVV